MSGPLLRVLPFLKRILSLPAYGAVGRKRKTEPEMQKWIICIISWYRNNSGRRQGENKESKELTKAGRWRKKFWFKIKVNYEEFGGVGNRTYREHQKWGKI